jgi:hypothetical protein
MIDYFDELECTIGVLTETWLADGKTLDQNLEDLQDGTGITMMCRNRVPGARGVAHGGVAILLKESISRATRLRLHNPGNYEVLGASLKIRGHHRRFIVLACYMPPSMDTESARECMQYITDLVHEGKRAFDSPHVVVAGDFNQFRIEQSLSEHSDLKECEVCPTRGERSIDRIFTNFETKESGSLEPLEPDEGAKGAPSDHRVAFCRAIVPGKESNPWSVHQYRPLTDTGKERFKEWILSQDWNHVLLAEGSNAKADAYQSLVMEAMDTFFPVRSVRTRKLDPPWYNDTIRKKERAKRKLFKRVGRTEEWKDMDRKLSELKETRRKIYLQGQRENLTGVDSQRQFYKTIKNYKSAEKPQQYDVKDLYPGLVDSEAAEELASFFIR